MLKAILFSVPVSLALVDCLGYVAKVEGISMQPSLNPEYYGNSDFVFLNRWFSRSFKYNRGEVVSLISPKDSSEKYIKRIIGLEGDLVRTIGYQQSYVRVPVGHCWVEGDNTGFSRDSNSFGPVPVGLITAKASCIVWPPSRWSRIKSDVPNERTPINLIRTSKGADIITPRELAEMLEED